MSGPTSGKLKSKRQLNKAGKRTRDVSTQVGKWLQLKAAVENSETLRAEVLQDVEKTFSKVGFARPHNLSPEDERQHVESREALCAHHIADLSLLLQPLNSCKWNV